MSDLNPLFSSFHLGSCSIKNRIVMSPMTRGWSPGGVPSSSVDNYYALRAKNNVGLIISEGIGIDHPSALGTGTMGEKNMPVLHGSRAIGRWADITGAVHDQTGKIFAQLWHQGPIRQPGTGAFPEAMTSRPSGLWGPFGGDTSAHPEYLSSVCHTSEPMSEEEIADIIHAYGRSASNAVRAGFDGIAIHGAHGYLIDAFLWIETNRRKDKWGGSVSARSTFAVEVIKEIKRSVEGLPVAFRFSQWKLQDYNAKLADTPLELAKILEPICAAGIDLFDVSARLFHQPAFEGSPLSLAGWVKKITEAPTMAVGGAGLSNELKESFVQTIHPSDNVKIAARAVESGEFDFIGVGRALLADPCWVTKLQKGESLSVFTPQSFESAL